MKLTVLVLAALAAVGIGANNIVGKWTATGGAPVVLEFRQNGTMQADVDLKQQEAMLKTKGVPAPYLAQIKAQMAKARTQARTLSGKWKRIGTIYQLQPTSAGAPTGKQYPVQYFKVQGGKLWMCKQDGTVTGKDCFIRK